jgi:hypothetical protein
MPTHDASTNNTQNGAHNVVYVRLACQRIMPISLSESRLQKNFPFGASIELSMSAEPEGEARRQSVAITRKTGGK